MLICKFFSKSMFKKTFGKMCVAICEKFCPNEAPNSDEIYGKVDMQIRKMVSQR